MQQSLTETQINIKGLTNDIRIVQLSDVHIGHHRDERYLEKIVRATNQLNPELVLITGDLVDADVALTEKVFLTLSQLNAPAYYVNGNHENEIDTAKTFQLLRKSGVKILENESVETHGVQLIGLNYMKADDKTIDLHPSDDKRTIQSVMATMPVSNTKPLILIHHSPVGIEYIANKKIDLVLAGHTHAGQIFPVTFIAKYIFPYNRGLYQTGENQVFVSQGAGTFMVPIRLGTINEINLIQLKAD